MKAIQKDFWREIQQTKSRFFSIFVLVALAVAFLSGLRSTAPDMKRTGDSYLDAQNFMDIQVLSELGLTENDLSFLLRQPNISGGEGAYVIDAFARAKGLDIVAKVYSLPEKLNQVSLSEGRLPVADNECAVDDKLLEGLGIALGDTVYLATEGDFADALARQQFTVVGRVVSPLYISVERGTSTLGAGRVAAYAYLAPAAFTMEYYTAAYLTVADAAEAVAFSPEYDTLVDQVVDTMEPGGKRQAALRRNDLVDEANEKLADAQIELDQAKADAEKELSDAWAELRDARKELDDGWQDVREGKETLARETADARQKLSDARTELTDAQIKLDDGEAEYAQGFMDYLDGKEQYNDGQKKYQDGLAEYEDGLAEYEKGQDKLDAASNQLWAASDQLSAAHSELVTRQGQFDGLINGALLPALNANLPAGMPPFTDGTALFAAMADPTVIDPATGATMGQTVCAAVDQVLAGMAAQLQGGIAQADTGIAQLEGGIVQTQAAIVQLEAAIAALSGGGTIPPGGGTTPPGDGTTPPGGGTTPPGDGTTPPGDGTTPPGDGTTPPGGGTTPPGGGTTPPGGGTIPPGDGTTPTPSPGGDETPGPVPGNGEIPGANPGTTPGNDAGEISPAEDLVPAAPLTATLLHAEGLPTPPTLEELQAQLAQAQGQLAILQGQLTQAQGQRTALQAQLAALPPNSAALLGAKAQLDGGWAQYQNGLSSYEFGVSEYQSGQAELRDAKKKLDDAKVELKDAKVELVDAKRELIDAEIKLTDARTELDDGWVEFADGQVELADGEAELVTQVAEARAEIDDGIRDLRDGEVEYNDGLVEYQDGKAEAEEKIGDAERELADARRKVADIGDGKWYILNRNSNPGYLGYGQDADRMGNLADLFPLLFFLVAALVCLTTMTRMVEEERVQIGSLKALGYTRWTISKKYVGYALLPSLLGGLLGLAIGYTLFPKMIFTAYQIMYQVPDIQLYAYADISAFSLLAGVGCTLLATLGACLATLASTPANLMRPRAPKPGKRVLLEYIRPLWRRMRFTHKVTARNLLRYHLRFWMTVAGIGGCTALIIAGFGLRSSLLGAMDVQYSEIYRYTAQLSVSDNLLPEERTKIEDYLGTDPRITATLPCHLGSVTAETSAYSLSVYLEAASPELGNFVALRDTKGNPLDLPDDGVIINQKLSEMLKVDVGDSFTVDGDTRAEVKVAGITEHYLGHFIYLSPAYYEAVFRQPCVQNAYLLTMTEDSGSACDAVFSGALSLPGVVAATRMLDTKDTYMRSMERIDFVVVIVILAAAALALVVLYNLSNINITERKRELATIRVLGFYDGEVSAYVNRENAVLTVFGIAFGIFCGHFLHVWLVKSVEIELMMFLRKTDPLAYLWAGLLTVGFSVVTALLAHRKMKRIDMVESLKSAE